MALHFYVAHVYPAPVVGAFFTGLATVLLLSAVARLGLDNSILRRVARHDSDRGGAVQPIGEDLALVSISGLGSTALVAGGGIYLATRQNDLGVMLVALAPAVVFQSVGTLFLEALKGARRTTTALLLQSGAASAVALGLLVSLDGILPTQSAAGIAYSIGTAVSAGAGYILLREALPDVHLFSLDILGKDLAGAFFRAAIEGRLLLFIAVGGIAVGRMPLFVAGLVGGQSAAAVYGVGSKLADALILILGAVNAHYAPRMASAWASGQADVVREYWKRSILVLSAAAVGGGLVVTAAATIVFPRLGYSASIPVHVVLVVGQIANLATGSVGFVLMMTDHERSLATAVWAGLAIAAPISIVLAVLLGPVGAAVGGSVALILTNLMSVRSALRGPFHSVRYLAD